MVRIPYIKIPSVRVGSIVPTSDIGTGGATPAPPTPSITYLTQWKIVGNSQVHTDPFLTQWKVEGNSVVDNNTILSCGDLGQDGKYHVKISNGATIFDIPLTEPLRKVNDIADTIEFSSTIEGKALVTRNVESKTVSAYNDADGNQVATTLPDDTILHIQNLYDYTQIARVNVNTNNISQRSAEIKVQTLTAASYLGFNMPLPRNGNYYTSCLFKNEDAKPNLIYSNSGNSSTVNSSDYQKTSLLKSGVTTFRYSALNNPTGAWEVNDVFFVKNINIFDIDAMFADCTDLKPANVSDFEALFPNLGCINRTNTATDVIVKDGKLYKEDESGIEILVPLVTPTTELIDVSPFPVSATDTYTSANVTPYSAFEYKKNVEIWSCGEYSEIDNKYHIVVLPQGKSPVDIALTEPLRMVNDVADTIEFPSDTEGKVLVTRNTSSIDLGTCTYGSVANGFYSDNVQNLALKPQSGQSMDVLCTAYPNSEKPWVAGCMGISTSGSIWIGDKSYESATAIKNALAGVEMIYKLATPTAELVDAPQIEEAESYTCVISQGAKAVSWSSFTTNSE